MGALAGWIQREGEAKISGTENVAGLGNIMIKVKYQGKRNEFAYGVVAGWGVTYDPIYLGGEMTLTHDTANSSHKYKLKKASFNGIDITSAVRAIDISSGSVKIKYKRTPALGFAPRIGVVVHKNVLLFAKCGVELSRDKVTAGGESSRKKTKVAFAPGAGIEIALLQNLNFRLQYEYSFGSKIKGHDEGWAGEVSYISHSVKGGLVYRF